MTCYHANFKVKGKVQGVWFRKYTQDKALELGLKGFVKNESDGTVYAEVESDDLDKIKTFEAWLHEGSPLSQVAEVTSIDVDKCIGFKDFAIRK